MAHNRTGRPLDWVPGHGPVTRAELSSALRVTAHAGRGCAEGKQWQPDLPRLYTDREPLARSPQPARRRARQGGRPGGPERQSASRQPQAVAATLARCCPCCLDSYLRWFRPLDNHHAAFFLTTRKLRALSCSRNDRRDCLLWVVDICIFGTNHKGSVSPNTRPQVRADCLQGKPLGALGATNIGWHQNPRPQLPREIFMPCLCNDQKTASGWPLHPRGFFLATVFLVQPGGSMSVRLPCRKTGMNSFQTQTRHPVVGRW